MASTFHGRAGATLISGIRDCGTGWPHMMAVRSCSRSHLRNRAADLFGAIGAAKTDDIGNAVDQNGGFAGACTCQDQQRAFGGKHSLLLHRFSLVKQEAI